MARFVSGEVVVVPFPFTDFSSARVRPADEDDDIRTAFEVEDKA